MRRRTFLAQCSQAILGSCILPTAIRAQDIQRAAESKSVIGSGDLQADLDKLIPKLMEEFVVPGLSIALIQDGRLLWRRGFGVRDSGSRQPVDNDTVFEAASVSKTVFAYAVMKLCEKAVIDLDAPLTKYAPKPFLEGDPRLDLITARHALSHTTGFQDFRSRREPLKIHFPPGTKFLYSGEGYYYLQSVMTQLTGRVNPKECSRYEAGLEVCATDIDPYLKRNLLTPFGMNSSGYVWNDTFEKHAAQPHNVEGKSSPKKKPTATDAARYASCGGLHTTPTDYARFLMEVVDPKESDAFRLGQKSLQEMLRPQVKLDDGEKIDGANSWALGWAIQQRKTGNVIVHSGGQAGFRSLAMASVERKSGFIVLTNGDNGGKVFYHPAFEALMNRLLAS
ncbi:MAG: serine hydrolase [Opitutaceae bacterium]|nr:serine hydrolase [Verrucomicrobiales bacterium]